MKIKIQIPRKLAPILKPYRYKAFSSGRGASKSWSYAQALIIDALKDRHLILCCREVQNTIRDSVHRILKSQIERLELTPFFKIGNNSIECPSSGSEFIFKGLFNERAADNIKSLEGVTRCWVEEAQTVSQNSLDMLIPTIREPGSEIWFSMNARFPEDPVWNMFFTGSPPPDSFVDKISWRDNPWFPQVLHDLMMYDKEISEARYLHTWEGELNSGYGNLIKREWWKRWNPEKPENYVLRFVSADTAFSKSTTADYSVLGLFGMTYNHLDLLDIQRGRWSYPELLQFSKEFYEKHSNSSDVITGRGPMGSMIIEKKASGQSLIQSLEDEGFDIIGYDPGTIDKVIRVNASIPSIYHGKLRIPPEGYAPWLEPFIGECSSFRDDMAHPYDDQVDMMTQAEATWRQTIN